MLPEDRNDFENVIMWLPKMKTTVDNVTYEFGTSIKTTEQSSKHLTTNQIWRKWN